MHDYLHTITDIFRGGQGTEHSFRPALKALIEASATVQALNEPKRVACGAPDFVVQCQNVPIGYIETKDIGEC